MQLNQLFEIIQDRKDNPQSGSYTNQLLLAGENQILKKINEEATEVVVAAKAEGDSRLIEEVADLFYHMLVLLASRSLTLSDVEVELSRRHVKPKTRRSVK